MTNLSVSIGVDSVRYATLTECADTAQVELFRVDGATYISVHESGATENDMADNTVFKCATSAWSLEERMEVILDLGDLRSIMCYAIEHGIGVPDTQLRIAFDRNRTDENGNAIGSTSLITKKGDRKGSERRPEDHDLPTPSSLLLCSPSYEDHPFAEHSFRVGPDGHFNISSPVLGQILIPALPDDTFLPGESRIRVEDTTTVDMHAFMGKNRAFRIITMREYAERLRPAIENSKAIDPAELSGRPILTPTDPTLIN